ncbi:hypothetical protein HMN09_00358700 [Mycena chlorophos]|uniref:Uncharacterized protein n=1 Tax=Mycena chlorophos TaxID=658473 RepID=A0A8H6TJ43_MYCCL|nr:hypothetical protein HMN09_00358700 [Mycena chlorophos]
MLSLFAPAVVLLACALSARAPAAPAPSPAVPPNPSDYYYPEFTCSPASGPVVSYSWGVPPGFDNSNSNQYLECVSQTEACTYFDGTPTGILCTQPAAQWDDVQTCGFYVCSKYTTDGLALVSFDWFSNSGETQCYYGAANEGYCFYDSGGNLKDNTGNCKPPIASPCRSSPGRRRRYRREDNFTAMLRRKMTTGQMVNVVNPRAS